MAAMRLARIVFTALALTALLACEPVLEPEVNPVEPSASQPASSNAPNNAPFGPATKSILVILRLDAATFQFTNRALTRQEGIRDCKFQSVFRVLRIDGSRHPALGTVGTIQANGTLHVGRAAVLNLLGQPDARFINFHTDCAPTTGGTSFIPKMVLKKIEPLETGQSFTFQGVLYKFAF